MGVANSLNRQMKIEPPQTTNKSTGLKFQFADNLVFTLCKEEDDSMAQRVGVGKREGKR